jgi:hypothetical protein
LGVSSSGVFVDRLKERDISTDEEFFRTLGMVYQEAFGTGAISYEEFRALADRDREKMSATIERLRGAYITNKDKFLKDFGLPSDVFNEPSVQTQVHDDGRLIIPLSDRVELEVRRLYDTASVRPEIYTGFGYFPDPIGARDYLAFKSVALRMQDSSKEFVRAIVKSK